MRLEVKPISDHNDLVSVEVHPRPPSTRPPSSTQQQQLNNILNTLQSNKAASSSVAASRPNSRLDALQAHQKTTSSLQQLQALDLFNQSQHTDEDEEDSNEEEEEDNFGFRLETDHYVRQIKQRRGLLFAQIDSTPAERLRRKVGYEIERR